MRERGDKDRTKETENWKQINEKMRKKGKERKREEKEEK